MGHLPGWEPSERTPDALSLVPYTGGPAVPLNVYKMSGHLVAQCNARKWGNAWLPEDSLPVPPGLCRQGDISNWCDRELRRRLFEDMHERDPDFPVRVRWFLEAIHMTGVELQGDTAMCTVVFPSIQYEGVSADQVFSIQWRDDDDYDGVSRQVVIGRWSDAGSIAVGLYLSSTQDQRQCIARGLCKLSMCMLDDNNSALNHVLQMMQSPRLSVVNCFKDYPYKGVEYDTSFLHGLITEHGKRWNYPALLKILHALLSRTDIDFNSKGWSWQKGETVSGRQLAFVEWCLFAGESRRRQLWVDPVLPRLYSLAVAIHLPEAQEAPQHTRPETLAANLRKLMDDEPLFHQQCMLRARLAGDLAALAEARPLPCGLLTPEDIGSACHLLSEMPGPRPLPRRGRWQRMDATVKAQKGILRP